MKAWASKIRGLSQLGREPLVRIIGTPGASEVHEYSAPKLMAAATRLLDDQRLPHESRVVLLLLPHSPELILLHLGLALNGWVPAILPWPTTRVDAEKYQSNLLYQLSSLPADHLITLPRLAENLQPGLPYRVSGCDTNQGAHFEKVFSERFTPDPPKALRAGSFQSLPEDALFLQFSGGTTGTQKCVVVTERMLEEQLLRLSHALKPTRSDGVVSWLPMYHDMGLIACLWFPLWAGIPSTHLAASDWLLRPELLLHLTCQYEGTMCWLPNFAFSYLAQRRDSMERKYTLDRVRAWVNCSEPVRLRSQEAFLQAFEDSGVKRESLQASYAMAENVFAVTQTDLSTPPQYVKRLEVRGPSSAYEQSAFEIVDDVYVSSGRCLPDMQIRVVGADGSACEELEAGQIQIATPCLFGGYWTKEGFHRETFTSDGWYATGDYGFLTDGELYVIGRIKDIIIVGGQNIFPEDLEAIASRAEGVYPGRVVAFGIEDEEVGTQNIAIVAEMVGDFEANRARSIELEIRRLITASIAVAPRYVSVVPQRWIVKSTAGKISRKETRERYLREKLDVAMPV
jgi:fatty-acyl-CoA synthase